MNNNKQEKKRGRETLIEPGHTAAFSFNHRRWVESIELYLVCERPKDVPAPETAQPGSPPAKATPDPVPVEDLGSP